MGFFVGLFSFSRNGEKGSKPSLCSGSLTCSPVTFVSLQGIFGSLSKTRRPLQGLILHPQQQTYCVTHSRCSKNKQKSVFGESIRFMMGAECAELGGNEHYPLALRDKRKGRWAPRGTAQAKAQGPAGQESG